MAIETLNSASISVAGTDLSDHCVQIDIDDGVVEKDALVGVIEAACERWRIPFFSCRGYTSQSELHAAGKRLARRAAVRDQDPLVLHLGDHDPSGIDMTRDITERVSMFARRGVEVRRLALSMAQVEELSPPPNPAKITDSRARRYIQEYGDESWELDALTPNYIADLIAAEVEDELDADEWAEALQTEETGGRSCVCSPTSGRRPRSGLRTSTAEVRDGDGLRRQGAVPGAGPSDGDGDAAPRAPAAPDVPVGPGGRDHGRGQARGFDDGCTFHVVGALGESGLAIYGTDRDLAEALRAAREVDYPPPVAQYGGD